MKVIIWQILTHASQLTLYLSNFRGVSTKHLQEYLDLFCFLKYLNWTTNYND